jgi:hypothetical protein
MIYRLLILSLASLLALPADDGLAWQPPASQEQHRSPQTPVARPAAVGWNSEWIGSSSVGQATTDVSVAVPLLGLLDGPPPLIRTGFGYTRLTAISEPALPEELFEYSIGLTWIRPVSQRWTVLSMLGAAMATDNENRSSDAWQFRGGVFGIYERNENWKWTFGALATGRQDLPVIPAVGVVYTPRPDWRVDLTFPRPRLSYRISETVSREQWVYCGIGFQGDTWAWQRSSTLDDRLTLRDWRVVAGWEVLPVSSGDLPRAAGRRLQLEIGYVFARELEFDYRNESQPLDDGWMAGLSTRF